MWTVENTEHHCETNHDKTWSVVRIVVCRFLFCCLSISYSQPLIFYRPPQPLSDTFLGLVHRAQPGGRGQYNIITDRNGLIWCTSCSDRCRNRKQHFSFRLPKKKPSFSTTEELHLDSAPLLSGWLKRNGKVLLVAGMRGLPWAPVQVSQAERATAVLQTNPPSFIYFCWNIDACYERFKIMRRPFFFPCAGFLIHK